MTDVGMKDLDEHEVGWFGAPLRSIGLKKVHHGVGGIHLERVTIRVLVADL